MKVNSEMLKFFWFLGKELVEKKSQYDWGSNFYVQVSKDLSNTLPDIKSFSPRNLLYMVQFYKMYSNTVIAHQLGAQFENVDSINDYNENSIIFSVPWGHHSR